MIRGVGIVGISLVFTCGVAAGGLCPQSALWGASFCLSACFAACLRWKSSALVFALVFFTGVTASILSAVPSFSFPPSGFIYSASCALRGHIRSMPWQDPATAELITALMTGDRSGLPRELVGVFRDSGAAHVLALSGLHLGTIYILLSRSLLILGNSRPSKIVRSVVVVLACCFYVLVTGAPKSVVRAFLFIFIRESASILGRRTDPVRVLCSALTLQLVFDPPAVFNIGFQLSYLAMAGIVLVYPWLKSFFPQGKDRVDLNPFRRLWNVFSLTLSCQALAGPLVWLRFGVFPRYFLLTNLLAMPLSTVLITLSAMTIGADALGISPDIMIVLTEKVAGLLVGVLRIIQLS